MLGIEKKFDHKAHVRLWDWLAKNPDKEKIELPEWNCNGGTREFARHSCFCCEYAGRGSFGMNCSSCPLVGWNPFDSEDREYGEERFFPCEEDGNELELEERGLHTRWSEAVREYKLAVQRSTYPHIVEQLKERVVELAERIRDLPVREGVLTNDED